MIEYLITPVPKPRMTRRDKWETRPCVLRYRAFKDEVRAHNVELDFPCKIIFKMPIPTSRSKDERLSLVGQPHTQTPDIDNLLKGLLDAVYQDDAHVWSVWAEKRWAETPGIEVMPISRGLILDKEA